MQIEPKDDKKPVVGDPSDPSPDKPGTSPDAVGGDTDAGGEVKLTKAELDSLKAEKESYRKALELERKKNKSNKGFAPEEPKDEVPDAKDPDTIRQIIREERQRELQAERVEHEEDEKARILKRFPALTADNDYGLDPEVVECYQDLVNSRSRRGVAPKTKADVAKLLERAVRIVHPALFENKGDDSDYSGMTRGEPLEDEKEKKPRLSPQDKAFTEHVESVTQK